MMEDGIPKQGSPECERNQCIVPKDVLREMLIKENELRLSNEMQAKFAALEVDTSYQDWLYAVEDMQRELVQSHGFGGKQQARALFELRCAAQLYPEEKEFREIPLYVKYNRAKHCSVRVGSAVPDLPLTQVTLNPDGPPRTSSLREVCCGNGLPTLVMAGSYS